VGCPATLPSSVEWTGTIRRTSGATTELVISIPSLAVFNQVIPMTFNGNSLQFFVAIDHALHLQRRRSLRIGDR
jgi:hypothetical protein